jgi:large subunit ribosomal protein L31
MKKEIHPAYQEVTFTCSCGNVIKTGSALNKADMRIEVCSKCHPFYTGKQKLSDVGGRLNKFRKKYGGDVPAQQGDTDTAAG